MGEVLFYAIPDADLTIQRFGGSLNKVFYERKKEVKLALTGPSAGLEETKRSRRRPMKKLPISRPCLRSRATLGHIDRLTNGIAKSSLWRIPETIPMSVSAALVVSFLGRKSRA